MGTFIIEPLPPHLLLAGMPSVLPEDVETVLRLRGGVIVRLQVISFFVFSFLLTNFVVQWLWNGLASEFPRLPRLTYGRSMILVTAWGLLFCVVLVMISGARELMTPDAWERQGATHRVKGTP